MEIDFVDAQYRRIRGGRAARLREDFCGTGNTSCEWVRRRPTNTAIGLDIDAQTLDWGRTHKLARLKPAARERIELIRSNVLTPPPAARGVDIVLAMNFSYNVFHERRTMLRYLRAVRRSLAPGGVLFMDSYGGWESIRKQTDRRKVGRFTYIWEQAEYDPVTARYACHIHFAFRDGSRLRRAFSYDWRFWSLPELRDLLADAGFSRTTVYWEGDDGKGGGDGEFKPVESAEQDPSWIAYISAER